MISEFDRWNNKVNRIEGGCWLWTGTYLRKGYGHFRRKIDGKWKMYKAHRYSYERYKGEIPIGLLVCHTCDVPSCVNPEHLFLGTHKDNLNDMVKKGRKVLGRNPKHKHLDYKIAEEMRKFRSSNPEVKQVEISKLFDVSIAQTSRILRNEIWKSQKEMTKLGA